MIEFFANYWRPILIIFSAISLTITIVKLIANSVAISKIQNNEIKHIIENIAGIKEEEKTFKKEIKVEIHNIFLAIRRLEKKQITRDSICEERHKK